MNDFMSERVNKYEIQTCLLDDNQLVEQKKN